MVHRVTKVQINRHKDIYPYLVEITQNCNNLYNEALYTYRNLYTSAHKDKSEWYDNEKEVNDLVSEYSKFVDIKISASGCISRDSLDRLFRNSKNRDYYALPAHVNYHVIKRLFENIKSFWQAHKDWEKHPEKYKAEPRLPKYLHKGGMTVATLSNQVCRIKKTKKGNYYLRFPKTDKAVNLGKKIISGRLMEVQVIPDGDVFTVILITEDGTDIPEKKEPKRVVSVDPGELVIMAVANNFGGPMLLFDGKPVRKANDEYNSGIASLTAKQTVFKNVKYAIKSHMYYKITRKRNNYIDFAMHRYAKLLIEYCLMYRVDTIVFGRNKEWKQNTDVGKDSNRRFNLVPYAQLISILRYMCEWNGIGLVLQEESYTSQASFLDQDDIPVYAEDDETEYHFSGRRSGRVYTSADGTKIHADLNGAANILRKRYPDGFKKGVMPDFRNIITIGDPNQVYCCI